MYLIGLASIAIAACAIFFAVRDTLSSRRPGNDSVTGFLIGAGLLATSYAVLTNRMHDVRPAVACSLLADVLGLVALIVSHVAATRPEPAKHLSPTLRQRSTSLSPDQLADKERQLQAARLRLIAVLARGAAFDGGSELASMPAVVRPDRAKELFDTGAVRAIDGRIGALRAARSRRQRQLRADRNEATETKR